MFELGTPELCKSTWNSPPGCDFPDPELLHADRWNKRETEFRLNGTDWSGGSNYFILLPC